MKKLVALLLALTLVAVSLTGCGGSTTTDTDDTSASDIAITVWCAEEIVSTITAQLDAYNEANGTSIVFTVEAVGEGDAATNMITDVTAGADIFCFAQDQLARLVQAGALSAVSDSLIDEVTANNDAGSVAAATINDTVYAFPLTSDNGYFMYYDSSILSEDDIADQTSLIAACEAAGKTIAFELTDSAWYEMAYFFATGCVSEWSTDTDGNFVSYEDTVNSAAGIIAAKGMAELINSNAFVNSSSASSFSSDAAVVVTGTWDSSTAKELLGDNMACASLWSFTVDGETYQLGSFSGYKLLGVKPQTDATKAAYCQSVAAYLTSEACQLERFESNGWGPSNLNAQASDAVQADATLAALAAQSAYSTPQGQYPNSWWDVGKAIGASIQALGTTTVSDSDIQAILDTYTAGLNEIMDPAFTGWVVVGDLDGVSWSTKGGEGDDDEAGTGQYVLTPTNSENPLIGTWEMDITIADVDWDSGFRICLYNDWSAGSYHDNGIGYSHLTEGSLGEEGGDNNVLLDAGTYHIVLTVTSDSAELTVTAAE